MDQSIYNNANGLDYVTKKKCAMRYNKYHGCDMFQSI